MGYKSSLVAIRQLDRHREEGVGLKMDVCNFIFSTQRICFQGPGLSLSLDISIRRACSCLFKIGRKKINLLRMFSDINVQHKSGHKQRKSIYVSYHRQKYIPPARGLGNASDQETRSSLKWSSFLLKIEMPPWIDEWQMSHFHLWASECSNSSAVLSRHDWNMFFLYEINRNERKGKKREGESAMMRFWLQ